MLIDQVLPFYDVTQVHEIIVHAPAEDVYTAVRDTDLRDPIIDALFGIRELPARFLRRLRKQPEPIPQSVTFGSLARSGAGAGGPGWVELAEEPGVEMVVGSVGRFWRHDYGVRQVTREEFLRFEEPGFARLAIGLAVFPSAADLTILRYEARTSTTDVAARRALRRYWRVIRPGVALVMRRALQRIKVAAERPVPAVV